MIYSPFTNGFHRYLMFNNFKSGAAPPGWTDVNQPDWVSQVAMTGDSLYSLHLSSNGTWADYVMPTAFSEVWGFFKFRFSGTIPSVTNFFNFQTSGGATQLQVNLNTNGTINLKHGSTSVTTTGAMTANTVYNVWTHYRAGSGANGPGSVGFSLTEQEATSGANFTSTNAGTATGTIGLFDPENTNTGGGLDFYYGKARLSTAAIGSFPA